MEKRRKKRFPVRMKLETYEALQVLSDVLGVPKSELVKRGALKDLPQARGQDKYNYKTVMVALEPVEYDTLCLQSQLLQKTKKATFGLISLKEDKK
jgi:hypothetical protein